MTAALQLHSPQVNSLVDQMLSGGRGALSRILSVLESGEIDPYTAATNALESGGLTPRIADVLQRDFSTD